METKLKGTVMVESAAETVRSAVKKTIHTQPKT